MQGIKKFGLPIVFMSILALHGIDQEFKIINEPTTQEKRAKVEKPIPKLSHLDIFPGQYEPYYNETFKWRDLFVRWGSKLKVFAMQESPFPDKVRIGKDGWYFKAGVAGEVYRGTIRFGQKEINKILEELKRRQRIVEAHGGKYYIAVPPIKHHIYEEYLPDEWKRNRPQSATARLLQALRENEELQYIDLFEPLVAAKEQSEERLYHKTDHHWTDVASLIAAQEIIAQMSADFPTLEQLDPEHWVLEHKETQGWALAEVLGIEDVVTENVPQLVTKTHLASDVEHQYIRPQGFPKPYVVAKETDRKEKPRIFVVRDSFGSALVKFLSNAFSYSFYLWDNWNHDLNEEIFVAEDCDIYLQLVWEGLWVRFLDEQDDDWYF